MKIAVITGSPRKNGNTVAMVDAFVKASEANGYSFQVCLWRVTLKKPMAAHKRPLLLKSSDYESTTCKW